MRRLHRKLATAVAVGLVSAALGAAPGAAQLSTRGDVNGDGAITALDALGILSHVVGKVLPEDWVAAPNGDTNCDETVAALDALIVLSHVVDKDVSQFCVGDSITDLPIVSDFEEGADGWGTFGDATGFTHLASGGNPGGHLRASDRATGQVWYFRAPERFLGDRSDVYGRVLGFDLKQSSTSSPFTADDLVLIGGGLTLTLRIGHHPATTWTRYQVALDESADWRIGPNGPVATRAQIETVLGALVALRIRGEYRNGSDTGYLDNVRFGMALPSLAAIDVEPDTLVLTATGATAQASATATDADGQEVVVDLSWRTGAETVATVGSDGLVTAVGLGETSVLAAAGGVEGSALVRVSAPPGGAPASSAAWRPSSSGLVLAAPPDPALSPALARLGALLHDRTPCSATCKPES